MMLIKQVKQTPEKLKRAVIFFWLTRSYFRRIGKQHPDFFVKHIRCYTDNETAVKIMSMRYSQDIQPKFEIIALDLGIDERTVYKHYKKVIESVIDG